MLGATVRGRIDFAHETLALSGTYVPFYGFNAVLGVVPLLGDLLKGRENEGVFGITFAVQGRTSNPDVRVNPVSMLAPAFSGKCSSSRTRRRRPRRKGQLLNTGVDSEPRALRSWRLGAGCALAWRHRLGVSPWGDAKYRLASAGDPLATLWSHRLVPLRPYSSRLAQNRACHGLRRSRTASVASVPPDVPRRAVAGERRPRDCGRFLDRRAGRVASKLFTETRSGFQRRDAGYQRRASVCVCRLNAGFAPAAEKS